MTWVERATDMASIKEFKDPFLTIPALSFVMAIRWMFVEVRFQDLRSLEAFDWVKSHQC